MGLAAHRPYFQLLGSARSALAAELGLKKGLKIMYAFDSSTFGKTWSVPSPGAVSLSVIT